MLNVFNKYSMPKRHLKTMLAAGSISLLTLCGCREKEFDDFMKKPEPDPPINVFIDTVPPRQYNYDVEI